MGDESMTIDARALMRQQGSLSIEEDVPLALNEYQQFTERTDKNEKPGINGLGFVLLAFLVSRFYGRTKAEGGKTNGASS